MINKLLAHSTDLPLPASHYGEFYIPAPKKHAPNGEDSHIQTHEMSAVSDGVGGAKSKNSKVLSQLLVNITADVIQHKADNGLQDALDKNEENIPLFIFELVIQCLINSQYSDGTYFLTEKKTTELITDEDAAATLSFGFKHANQLHICTYGDSPFIVLTKEGQLKAHIAGTNLYSEDPTDNNYVIPSPEQLSLLDILFCRHVDPYNSQKTSDKPLHKIVTSDILDHSFKQLLQDSRYSTLKRKDFNQMLFHTIDLEDGDIIIAASDCLGDCLPLSLIEEIAQKTRTETSNTFAKSLAQNLCKEAEKTYSGDNSLLKERQVDSPFKEEVCNRIQQLLAQENPPHTKELSTEYFEKNPYTGKRDDNTVVVTIHKKTSENRKKNRTTIPFLPTIPAQKQY